MIKIQTILNPLDSMQSWYLLRADFQNECKKLKIKFTNHEPDILIVNQTMLSENILNSGIPIIILERIDSCSITKRRELKHKNVIGIIKNTSFRDPNYHNLATYNGRYHSRLVIENNDKIKNYSSEITDYEIQLNENDFQKIELGWTFGLYEKFKNCNSLNINFDLDRDVDINFYGTVDYKSDDMIKFHRYQCLDTIKDLKNCIVKCGDGRPLLDGQYRDLLIKSKATLSPWGYGEACYRDFEAIYYGSILIKPDSSHVIGKQDIYQNNKYYISCKIDFSDLQEKVDYIRNNWEQLKEMRISAREYLFSFYDIKKQALDFKDILDRCCSRIKKM